MRHYLVGAGSIGAGDDGVGAGVGGVGVVICWWWWWDGLVSSVSCQLK